MTYSLLVQNSIPLGYWQLNGTGNDFTSASNNAVITNATYTVPSLTINSSSSLLVKPSGASVVINNIYDTFYSTFEKTQMYFEFWFSFNSNLDGSGYLKNLSSASQYFTNNILKILKIMNNSVEIGSINYDYTRNTFRFSINGNNNSDAYIPVKNLNNSFYIVCGYKNKTLSINVNGETGAGGVVNDSSLFPDRKTSSVQFVADSTSLNSTASFNYIISDLAIYNYSINKDQMRKKVVWAFNNDKPSSITGVTGTSYFDTYETDLHVLRNNYVHGTDFNQKVLDFNLNINDLTGLTPQQNILDVSINSNSNVAASVQFSSSGVKINDFGSLLFKDFGKILQGYNNFTLNTQIYFTGTSSVDYIFSFPDKNTNNNIFGTIEKTGFYIKFYDYSTASITTLLSYNTTVTTGSYNFAFSTNSGSYYMYATASNGTGSTIYTASFELGVDYQTQLEIGNFLTISSSNSYSLFKNFGITTVPYNNFSGFDFTENKMFMSRFTQNLSVSQLAYWITSIPFSSYGMDIIGSKVTWDSMDNMLVQTSTDGGSNWTTIQRGSQIPTASYKTLTNDVLIKFTTPYEYSIENLYQSLDTIQIILYKDLSFFSRDNKYYMYSIPDTSGSHTYTLQRMDGPINYRKDNFGIKFDKITGVPDGYAIIVSSSQSSPLNLYAIDFYLKHNSIISGKQNFILNSDPGTASPTLYVDGITSNTYRYPSGSLFVNGNFVSDNTFTPKVGEFYHLMFAFGGQYNGSAIYIGGNLQGSASTHIHSNIGYINLWPYQISASSASTRFGYFVSNNIVQIVDSVNNNTRWQPNWNINSINSTKAYKIGRI